MPDMASTETTPLLLPAAAGAPSEPRPKTARSVTFHPNPVTRTIEPDPEPRRVRPPTPSSAVMASGSLGGGPPMLAALNHKLRRRNSYGSVPQTLPPPAPAPKIGPQRSTKNAQKLKLLPNPEVPEDGPDEESGRDVYSQYTRIKDPTARRDAARLGKADRDRLPRVTAYCTANKYQTDGLMRYLKGPRQDKRREPQAHRRVHSTRPTATAASSRPTAMRPDRTSWPSRARPSRTSAATRPARSRAPASRGTTCSTSARPSAMATPATAGTAAIATAPDAHAADDEGALAERLADFDMEVHMPEVFLFDYGVVVIWGMTLADERRFLKEIARFETEKLAPDDVETEYFNFYYTREYQPRIYNDFITLRDKNNYMTKLAISHALAQSVKVRSALML